MSAPEDFIQRATILFCNSNYGYQCPRIGTIDDDFVICWCDDLSNEQVQNIKNLSGSITLEHNDFIGHGYIKIKWFEYTKISDIFNAMLQLGLCFKTNNKAAVIFRPAETKVFTNEIMEKKFIEQTKELMMLIPRAIHDDYYIKEQYLDIWNYITDEGRDFCRYLRQLKHLPEPDMNHQENYWNWPLFQNYDPNTLLTLEEPINKKIKEADEVEVEKEPEDRTCLICMDKEADTMVLPCSCNVVCKDCSIGLRNTNDHNVCVKCRRPITDILE